MSISYPATWIQRVQLAPKLAPSPDGSVYRSPDGAQEVDAVVVEHRVAGYVRAEAARRKQRRLTRDDERVCREYVLLLDNWRTGHWDRKHASPLPAKWTARRARRHPDGPALAQRAG